MFADERAIRRTLVSEQAGYQLDSSSYFSPPVIVASLTFGPTPSEHEQSRALEIQPAMQAILLFNLFDHFHVDNTTYNSPR